ncbi:unnamed protein product, partial [Polarella glacialis]
CRQILGLWWLWLLVDDATHVAIVTEVVDHHEPAAEIDPLEAQIIVWQQEAGFIERNLNSASAREGVDRIWLCTFNRFPDELRRALHHGPALQQSREALELAGMDWQLRDSGAMVIVHAWQYQQVIAALPPQLGHRDLVIASSLEYLLELDLATLLSPSGGLKGAWVQARHEVDVVLEVGSGALSEDSEERSEMELAGASGATAEDWEVRVARTFLCAAPVRQRNIPLTQSDTTESDVDARRQRNPRRAAALLVVDL